MAKNGNPNNIRVHRETAQQEIGKCRQTSFFFIRDARENTEGFPCPHHIPCRSRLSEANYSTHTLPSGADLLLLVFLRSQHRQCDKRVHDTPFGRGQRWVGFEERPAQGRYTREVGHDNHSLTPSGTVFGLRKKTGCCITQSVGGFLCSRVGELLSEIGFSRGKWGGGSAAMHATSRGIGASRKDALT